MRKILILILLGLSGFLLLLDSVRTLYCNEISEEKSEIVLWYPSKPFKEILKSGNVLEYVENASNNRIAYIVRITPQGEGNPFHYELLIHKAQMYIFTRLEGRGFLKDPSTIKRIASDYAVTKVDDKILFLSWEFGKYGDSSDPDKVPCKTRWEHSKAYAVDWNGQGIKEVNKDEYYYYDAEKDQVVIKPPYKDYRKHNVSELELVF